ncbi:hypothetical protein [Streptosporangium sp. KLBMP 9127]|nr:hypothetical protein [Streptosporangium sp. KLBMP 9127]
MGAGANVVALTGGGASLRIGSAPFAAHPLITPLAVRHRPASGSAVAHDVE